MTTQPWPNWASRTLVSMLALLTVCHVPTAAEFYSSFYMIETCGWRNPYQSPEQLSNVLANVNQKLKVCSFNQSSFELTRTLIVPVPLNCTGSVPMFGNVSIDYSFNTSCGSSEMFAWTALSERYAKAIYSGNSSEDRLAQFIMNQSQRRVVIILPPQVNCGFQSTTPNACPGRTCTGFIVGNAARSPSIVYREIQNMNGLIYAAKNGDQYGDKSDAVSGPPGLVCHNAPHVHKLGWGQPLVSLTEKNFTKKNNHKIFTIKSMSFGLDNMVRIRISAFANNVTNNTLQPNISVSRVPTYYVSYRTKTDTYDRNLSNVFNGKLSIHKFNGLSSNMMSLNEANVTYLLRVLSVQEVWESPLKVFIVRLLQTDQEKAMLDVCRMYSPYENVCNENWDLDCDGLFGQEDPDCQEQEP